MFSLPSPYAGYTGLCNCGSVRKDDKSSLQAHSIREKKRILSRSIYNPLRAEEIILA